jgi:predicted  nucleic acid-binding Zn-ribbon protein
MQTNEVFLNPFYDSDVFNISLNNKVKYQNYDRLQTMLDDINKILPIKERTIEDLNVKIIKLESKIKEGEIKIIELKSKNNCETHLNEISSLKIKVQHIRTKSWALRTSSDLSCSTKTDLEKIYVGQKMHDKIKLEYIESLSLSIFKVIGSPKKKGEQSQK